MGIPATAADVINSSQVAAAYVAREMPGASVFMVGEAGVREACARELDAVHGAPIGAESGTPQELIVVGMGKLGGGELNFSSDIDLVFLYPEASICGIFWWLWAVQS